MEAAKAAISKHLGSSGKHTTTHHEAVAPAVQHETVKPTRHEDVTTAVDREVHQDHYHTSVQHITDAEKLAEKHTQNVAPVQHVQRDHDDRDLNARTLQAEAGKYRDQQVIADTQNTQSVAPTVGGEHVHHHVHETVQPVVHKTTIQPEVVHTTIPVHEEIHKAAQHHGSVQLPTMTMDEYKSAGRTLQGTNTEKTEHFQGEPRSVAALAPVFGNEGLNRGEHARDQDHAGAVNHSLDSNNSRHQQGTDGLSSRQQGTDGLSTRQQGTDGLPPRDNLESRGLGSGTTSGLGHERTTGVGSSTSTTGVGSGVPTATGTSTSGFGGHEDPTAQKKKPSLMDKLNPKIDSNGDGKAGFMK